MFPSLGKHWVPREESQITNLRGVKGYRHSTQSAKRVLQHSPSPSTGEHMKERPTDLTPINDALVQMQDEIRSYFEWSLEDDERSAVN